MKKRKIVIIGVLVLTICFVCYVINVNIGSGKLNYNPPRNGVVPDAVTAIRIAEAIGIPVFGENINDYKPFQATLEDDSVWHVYGLPKKTWFSIQFGGCPQFMIQKKDGKVLDVYLSR